MNKTVGTSQDEQLPIYLRTQTRMEGGETVKGKTAA